MLDNCLYLNTMAEKFNIKEGLVEALKTALKNDEFIAAVFDMLFGEKNADKKVEYYLKEAAQENTLNEIVAVHRLYKQTLKEGMLGNLVGTPKELMEKLMEIRKKSIKFQRKVLIRTLKKPGMLGAFLYVVKALLTPGYVLDDILATPQAIKLITCLVETAIEVASEEQEMQPALNEEIEAKKLRRIFKHASRSRSMVNEDIEDSYGGRMPVNIYTGRFQPFHLGHLSNLEEAAKRGLRTVICPVMKGTSKSAKDHPFEAVEGEMFERIKNAYGDLVADIVPIKNPFIEFWILPLRERGYEPIMWTTGSDRQPAYEAMVEKYRDKYELNPNFEVVGLDKDMDAEGGSALNTGGISGTAIRKCLVNGDEEGFRRQMPKCLWDMYDEMREIMLQQAMPAAQSIMESEAYKKYKQFLGEAIENLVKGEK